ncbi:hypothetical protein PFISCL1PPCAC_4389 [Pristionchus fissidentatus]|uniref:Uncharacterized protein n=1 Tax=Pristionchus fissidentatus TaxID=1538716 RepID=A0AAV5V491_9BILA|nr:hypothetical protein PFISCL1PPCAC_4389 [Pristionchus fissidentatus]
MDALDCALKAQPFYSDVLLSFKGDAMEVSRNGESTIAKFAYAFSILLSELRGSIIGSTETTRTTKWSINYWKNCDPCGPAC